MVDFTGAGKGWLPMCDAHKQQDDALMELLTSSPAIAGKFKELVDNATKKESEEDGHKDKA